MDSKKIKERTLDEELLIYSKLSSLKKMYTQIIVLLIISGHFSRSFKKIHLML